MSPYPSAAAALITEDPDAEWSAPDTEEAQPAAELTSPADAESVTAPEAPDHDEADDADPDDVGDRGAPDVLRLYLTEVGRIRRLTREEEVTLVARITEGDAAAERRMIEANLRLVVALAKRYVRHRLPLADLIQEGNLGLMIAVRRFRLGEAAFSTYAAYWIRARILRALQKTGRIVRLPSDIEAKLARAARARQRLEHRLGRAVTEVEVEDELLATGESKPPRDVPRTVVSLDAPLRNSEDELTVGSAMEDFTTASPEETSTAVAEAERVSRAVAGLKPSEARVLSLRYGLGSDDEPLSLEAAADLLDVTRARVHQIERQAMARLKKRLTTAPWVKRGPAAGVPVVGPPGGSARVRLRTRRGVLVREF